LRVRDNVIFNKKLVICVDDCPVCIVLGNPTPKVGASDARKQDFGVDPVALHLSQALLRGTRSSGTLIGQSGRLVVLGGSARKFESDRPQWTSLNKPSVTAIGKSDTPWRSSSIFVRYSMDPSVNRDLKVGVCADDVVIHGWFFA
jgi:hypothetical protein